jgi:porphobilinogen synthase
MRRNRQEDWSRRLVAENALTVDDLIWPVFVIEGGTARERRPLHAGGRRASLDSGPGESGRESSGSAFRRWRCSRLCPREKKSARRPRRSLTRQQPDATARCAALKKAVPEIGMVGDVALDPYTDHGHDGVLMKGPGGSTS